ncbi:MBL fold metallo-hydrolase [Roseobacter weihaiensis]|uniref:MBL fold metallo-hydrolase n=1 Tax=Roseobacter weihaiensis TaxID=2763262 RepID=UPI001D0AE78A|nr:MBL fold metallo-hydrolase [Roseobacter sp. H9]
MTFTSSRRAVLTAPLAVATLLTLPRTAFAASAKVGVQMPGAYRTQLGAFEVTTLLDGELRRTIDERFITNVPMYTVRKALESELLPTEFYDNHYNFTAINTGNELILVDVGTGGRFDPSIDQGSVNMEAAGINPADVDMIIHTHFHLDHVGGLTDADGQALYPNAQVFFPELDYQFITDTAARAGMNPFLTRMADHAVRALAAYEDRLELYGDGKAFVPGISAIASPGHTPGHMCVHVESEGEELIVLGDSIGFPELFLANPGWHMSFDGEPTLAVETRKRLLDRIVADGVRIIGYHFTFPGIGRVSRADGRYRFHPEKWRAQFG